MRDLMSMFDDIKLETSEQDAYFEDESAAKCAVDIFVYELEEMEQGRMPVVYYFPRRDEWQSILRDRIKAEYQRRKEEREAKEKAEKDKLNAWLKRMREED